MMDLDFADHSQGQDEYSVEDVQFLHILAKGIHKVDAHYEMPLPFRNGTMQLLNNRSLAFKRLIGLQRRMQQN